MNPPTLKAWTLIPWTLPRSLFCLLLAIETLSRPASAQETWNVHVECPELSAEERAQLEVRHLVELQALDAEPATLVLRCSQRSIEGFWQHDGVTSSRRAVSRAADDNVLELSHWLASMLIGVRESSDDPEAAGTGGIESSPQNPSPGGGGVATATTTATEDPAAQQRASAPEEDSREASASSAAQQKTSSSAAEASPRSPSNQTESRPWFAGLGALYSQLGSEFRGAVGVTAIAGASLSGPWGLATEAGYRWGLQRPDGFSAQEAALAVHGRIEALPWLAFLVGPSLSWLVVQGDDQGERKSSLSFTGGGEVALRASYPARGPSGFFELGLRGLVTEREVRSAGETKLTVPRVLIFAALGGRFGAPWKK